MLLTQLILPILMLLLAAHLSLITKNKKKIKDIGIKVRIWFTALASFQDSQLVGFKMFAHF